MHAFQPGFCFTYRYWWPVAAQAKRGRVFQG